MKLIDTPALQIIKVPMSRGLFAHELNDKYPGFCWTYEDGFGEWEVLKGTYYWCLQYQTRNVITAPTWEDFWPQAEKFIRAEIESKKNNCDHTTAPHETSCDSYRGSDIFVHIYTDCWTLPSLYFMKPGSRCDMEVSQCHDLS